MSANLVWLLLDYPVYASSPGELALLLTIAHAMEDDDTPVAMTERELAERTRMSPRNVRRLLAGPPLHGTNERMANSRVAVEPGGGRGRPKLYKIHPELKRRLLQAQRQRVQRDQP